MVCTWQLIAVTRIHLSNPSLCVCVCGRVCPRGASLPAVSANSGPPAPIGVDWGMICVDFSDISPRHTADWRLIKFSASYHHQEQRAREDSGVQPHELPFGSANPERHKKNCWGFMGSRYSALRRVELVTTLRITCEVEADGLYIRSKR